MKVSEVSMSCEQLMRTRPSMSFMYCFSCNNYWQSFMANNLQGAHVYSNTLSSHAAIVKVSVQHSDNTLLHTMYTYLCHFSFLLSKPFLFQDILKQDIACL